jgi:hypothetical protein
MRIPSQFNHDSLYRRDNRHRDTTSHHRRLIRLILGLALVIVVMRQASQPAMYQVFFDPSLVASTAALQDGDQSEALLPNAGIASLVIDQEERGEPGDDQSDGPLVTAENRRIADAILADLLPTDQQQWWLALTRWSAGQKVPQVPSSIESVSITLRSLYDISEESRSAWQEMFRSFTSFVARGADSSRDADAGRDAGGSEATDSTASVPEKPIPSEGGPPNDTLPILAAMLTALDEAATSRVVDGSVWRAGDFDSLYRFLDQARNVPRRGVVSTSVIPLLQQPEVFRNQWVRIRGGVARVEQIEAQENPFGITHYWQLWLRPIDGADRPMVSIVPSIPDSVAAVDALSTKLEGPEVVVVGRYLKRLAYQSGIGADLAPVVVGAITSAPIAPGEATADDKSSRPEAEGPAWWPIALASLIGVAFAIGVMWRTAAAAKRARELRTSHRSEPDSFLRELRHHEEPPTASRED